MDSLNNSKSSFRFLVVDDSEFARRNMKKILTLVGGESAGFAANGKEAIEQYLKLKPDLVFMDITMPEMEGVEAVQGDPRPRRVGEDRHGQLERLPGHHQRGARLWSKTFPDEARRTETSCERGGFRLGRGLVRYDYVQPFVSSAQEILEQVLSGQHEYLLASKRLACTAACSSVISLPTFLNRTLS